MAVSIERGSTTVGLALRREGNRRLLADLLDGHEVVDVDEVVPDGTDLCVVDEGGLARARGALADWRDREHPRFAPVLLLAEGANVWRRHGTEAVETVDAIHQVPAPRSAILARVDGLLETRRYSRELAGQRQLVERLFETSPVATTVLDTDGTFVRANARAEAVLGLSASELRGRAHDAPAWQLTRHDGSPVPPGELPFDRVMATGQAVYGEELALERPDGERVLLSVNLAPVRDEAGGVEYLVSAMQDVTEERRLERELRASEDLHRTTLENITDTVVITDDEGAFTYVCPNTHHVFGYTTDEVRELGAIDALLGADPAPDDLADEGLVENRELTVTDADGETHTVLATVKAVAIAGGTRLYSVRDVTERAAAEQALRETEASRSLALEAADAGVWGWDLEADQVVWDESLEALLGVEPDRAAGLEEVFTTYAHPDDVPVLRATFERAMADLEPFEVTFRFGPDGEPERWLDLRGRLLTADDGEPERLLGVVTDVTARREHERALEQYEAIVEAAPDPIYGLDANGDITLANEAFARSIGRTPDELVGTSITGYLDQAEVEASLEHIAALAADEDPGTLELTIETVEGPRLYEVNVALHEGFEPEDVPGTVGVARDITDVRERERLLRRASQAIEASGHAVYITDPDGTITYANPAFEQVTGYPPEEAVGRQPSLLNTGEHDAAYYEELWDTVRAGEVWDEEIVNRRRDGERYHADQTIAPITDDEGEIEGFVAIQTDVSDHKDRLRQLQVMDRVLRHNLHNALNVIMGRADLIAETATGQVAADAAIIGEKSDELLDLTDKQRRITQVLSSEPTLEPVDVVALLRRLVEEADRTYPDADVTADLVTRANALATDGLEDALRELIENAVVHHDRDPPSVRVTLRRYGDTVSVRVADTGPGIPETERRIVTGEREIAPLYHGSGLGLWLVWWTVQRSGGHLSFEEHDPRGSVVTIDLRAAQDGAADDG